MHGLFLSPVPPQVVLKHRDQMQKKVCFATSSSSLVIFQGWCLSINGANFISSFASSNNTRSEDAFTFCAHTCFFSLLMQLPVPGQGPHYLLRY